MSEPIAFDAFERLAVPFDERAGTKPHNAYYDRPAVLSLLPDVRGLRVLDAGCGPGHYAEWLVERGAEVVGLDVSPSMIRLAGERLGGRARVFTADLDRPLSMLEDGAFDLVLSALVLEYVEDWGAAFREFARVLAGGGLLVFSCVHPFEDHYTREPRGNYFDRERMSMTWRGFGVPVDVPSYRRSLQAMINPLIESGFALDHLLEPRPVPEFAERDPRHYAELMKQPGFLCVRARKHAGS